MSTTIDDDKVAWHRPVKSGEPAWPIALLFPLQGEWTETEYLALDTNRPIELSEGCLEFLPLPTMFHQRIVQFLFGRLSSWVNNWRLGEVLMGVLPIRLWPGTMRVPELMLFRPTRISNPHDPLDGADLVMEVVSPGEESRKRDLHTKREEYAKAGISEYWIVDPQETVITVLTLDGSTYQLHGDFEQGSQATSVMLPGFMVDVASIFEAGKKRPTAPQP